MVLGITTSAQEKTGIGLVLAEGDGPIFIQAVKPGGAAARDGTLQPGDKIVAVNGVLASGKRIKDLAPEIAGTALSWVEETVSRNGSEIKARIQRSRQQTTPSAVATEDVLMSLVDAHVPDFWEEGSEYRKEGDLTVGDIVVVRRNEGAVKFAKIMRQAGRGLWTIMVSRSPELKTYPNVADATLGRPTKQAMTLLLQHHRALASWNQLESEEENASLEQVSIIKRLERILMSRFPHDHHNHHDHHISAGRRIPILATQLNFGRKDRGPAHWPDQFEVEPGYRGPHLTWPLTSHTVNRVISHICTQPTTPLHPKYIAQLLGRGVEMLSSLPNVTEIKRPTQPGGKVVVLGDTHGQINDLLWVLHQHGRPSPSTTYLFNGDFVDRGDNGVEVVLVMLMYKILHPEHVFMNRGNHECLQVNRMYGFSEEVNCRHHPALFMMFQELFKALPLASVVDRHFFVAHAGVAPGMHISQIQRLDRAFYDLPEDPGAGANSRDLTFLWALLWADPMDSPGCAAGSARGRHCLRFGPDVTAKFLAANRLGMVVRSHEVPRTNRGFECRHNNQLMTLFSASNYTGVADNLGGVLVLGERGAQVSEHMAPSLAELERHFAAESPRHLAILGRTGSSWKSMQLSRSKMELVVLQRIEAKVLERREALREFWAARDDGAGHVTPEHWCEGMATVLRLPHVHWSMLQERMTKAVTNAAGAVDFEAFLLEQSGWSREESRGWDSRMAENKVLNLVLPRLARNAPALRHALSYFDYDDDGRVARRDLRNAASALNEALAAESEEAPLSEEQLNAVQSTGEEDHQGMVDYESFLSELKIIVRTMPQDLPTDLQQAPAGADEAETTGKDSDSDMSASPPVPAREPADSQEL